MKLSVFKTLPVVSYSNRDLCGLPLSVRAIIEAFATREALDLPRQLTEGRKLFSSTNLLLKTNIFQNTLIAPVWATSC